MQSVGPQTQSKPAYELATEKSATGGRLVSLDAFRGATMALMVLVNTPGNVKHVYWPLQHAQWHGWTLTDLVFPSFLWVVGVAITLALGRSVARGDSRLKLFGRAARRAAILYGIGVFLYAYPAYDFSTLRLLGVLQRIAICYLIAVAIYLTTRLRGQIVWIVSLLAGYWLLMALAPVPGYGAGRLDLQGNLAHYVDRIVLGAHNYAETKTWDPEGILSTLPAIATTLFGLVAGRILQSRRSLGRRTLWLLAAGAVLIAAGLITNTWLPINKNLWTSSFCLFMAGLDFAIFAVFLWLVDGMGFKRAVKPLVIMGMNAIAIYLISESLDGVFRAIRWPSDGSMISVHRWLYQNLFAQLASPVNASLLYALAYTLLMFLLAYGMYRRRWFLKV